MLSDEEVKGRTLGALQLGTKTLYTIEKPWRRAEGFPAGIPYESCIPKGEYLLIWRDSPSKGVRLHLVNPDLGVFLSKDQCSEPWHRFSCMFHTANYARNVEGCIGPGKSIHDFGPKNGWGVSTSAWSLSELETYVEAHNITRIEII